jgi:hypothetical protein
LVAQFRAEATMREELDEGYGFQLPGDKKHLELVLGLITAERECCRLNRLDGIAHGAHALTASTEHVGRGHHWLYMQ